MFVVKLLMYLKEKDKKKNKITYIKQEQKNFR